jgi:hypothetical protein
MIIRCTQKVRDKIKIKSPDIEDDDRENAFLEEWYVNLFTIERKKYFIITESLTLYSIVLSSIGVNRRVELEQLVKDTVLRLLKNKSSPEIEKLLNSEVKILKTKNKQIIGSQNDLKYMAEVEAHYFDIANFDKINRTPMSYLKYSSPEEELGKRIMEIKEV